MKSNKLNPLERTRLGMRISIKTRGKDIKEKTERSAK